MQILIVKTSALGDIIQCYPVLNYLKALDPTVHIDWIVEEAAQDLVSRHPYVRSALPIQSKLWRKQLLHPNTWSQISTFKRKLQSTYYDVVFDLQGNCKSAVFTAMARGRVKVGFGRRSVPESPNLLVTQRRFDPDSRLNVRDRYIFLLESFFGQKHPATSGPALLLTDQERSHIEHIATKWASAVIVCPHSRWTNKQVPMRLLAAALRELQQETGLPYLLSWGNAQERATAEDLCIGLEAELLPALSLPEFQGLMARAVAVVSMDSLPLHLCGTTSTPCFGFFGPSLGSIYSPSGVDSSYHQGTCPYNEHFMTRCRKLRSCATGACMATTSERTLVDWWHQRIASKSTDA
ncbi:MAG: lipopolysaccharide heptosyltransferase I, partial [Chlamydiia bacterium]|nr:lipopolysaccharide heptosyltransferase I [Chlamydiia bacterium]